MNQNKTRRTFILRSFPIHAPPPLRGKAADRLFYVTAPCFHYIIWKRRLQGLADSAGFYTKKRAGQPAPFALLLGGPQDIGVN